MIVGKDRQRILLIGIFGGVFLMFQLMSWLSSGSLYLLDTGSDVVLQKLGKKISWLTNFIATFSSPMIMMIFFAFFAASLWMIKFKIPAVWVAALGVFGWLSTYILTFLTPQRTAPISFPKGAVHTYPNINLVLTLLAVFLVSTIVLPEFRNKAAKNRPRILAAMIIWSILVFISVVSTSRSSMTDAIVAVFYAYFLYKLSERLYVIFAPELLQNPIFKGSWF